MGLKEVISKLSNRVMWNNQIFDNGEKLLEHFDSLNISGSEEIINITILPKEEQSNTEEIENNSPVLNSVEYINDPNVYKITVKPFMTKPPTEQYNFHIRWNNGRPMPLQVMIGKKIKETSGMIFMELTSVDRSKVWNGWIVKSAILRCEKVD